MINGEDSSQSKHKQFSQTQFFSKVPQERTLIEGYVELSFGLLRRDRLPSRATREQLRRATPTVPIVFALILDPVRTGFVDSLAWPASVRLQQMADEVIE
jgi:hypothetical protein